MLREIFRLCSLSKLIVTISLLAFGNVSAQEQHVEIRPYIIYDTIFPGESGNSRSNDARERINAALDASRITTFSVGKAPQNNARISVPGIPELTIDTIGSTCEQRNGQIAITATGGTPPYLYSIDGSTFYTIGFFPTVQAGVYNVVVKDAKGEMNRAVVTVKNQYEIPQGYLNSTSKPSGCMAEDARSSITMTKGLAPFTYSTDRVNYQASNTFTNLPAGWFTFYARDANGCSASIPGQPLTNCIFGLSLAIGGQSCSTDPAGGGDVSVTAYYGKIPYEYSIDGINFQSEGKFTGLSAGIQKLYIRDANAVTMIYAFQVYESCNITFSGKSASAECGRNNGSVTLSAEKGVPPYQYTIDGVNYQNSNVFPDLAPGNYSFMVKDAVGKYRIISTQVVNSGCLSIQPTIKNTICDYNDGSISLNVSNGNPPYQYSIDGSVFQTSNVFSQLPKGSYTVTIKDANNITKSVDVVVGNEPGPYATVAITPISCKGNDGTITITAIGGKPPLQYGIAYNDYKSTNIFTGLSQNFYHTYVKDANGCIFTSCCTTFPIECLTMSLAKRDAGCPPSTGQIEVTASNGTAPYNYSIDGINFKSSPIFNNLAPGTYTITVKDADNKVKSQQITIGVACFTIKAVSTAVTCDAANGTIEASVTGGEAPYLYAIDNKPFQASGRFTNIRAGQYAVTVKDATGAINSATINVAAVPPPVININITDASCFNHDGKINVAASSGKAPFQYAINSAGFQSNRIYNSLDTGTYIMTVRDADGCLVSERAVVKADINTLIVNTGEAKTICKGRSVELNTSGNANNFSWRPIEGLANSNIANPVAAPTVTTKYYLTASLPACTKIDSVTVHVNAAPIAISGRDTAICYGQNMQLNGAGGVSFQWSPATYLSNPFIANPIVIKPALSVQYKLTVTNEAGCQSLNNAVSNITVTPPPLLFIGNDTVVAEGQPVYLQTRDVNLSGFTTFSWQPSAGLENTDKAATTATAFKDIIYKVTAVARGGCEASANIKIKVYKGPVFYVPTGFTPNGDGLNDIFRITAPGIREFKFLSIFNRYGQRIFHSTQLNYGWDGRFKGALQDQGTFVWMVAGIDYMGRLHEQKGTITLLR